MYKKNKITKTSITVNQSTEGETIETKVERIVNNKEPITDNAPIMYSERKDGVLPGTNIRTDRFEIAVDGMTHVSQSRIAKRESRLKALKGGENKDLNIGGAEPIQGK